MSRNRNNKRQDRSGTITTLLCAFVVIAVQAIVMLPNP